MRHTPLLVILLCITLSARVCAEDGGVVEASTIPAGPAIEAVSQESTYEGLAVKSDKIVGDKIVGDKIVGDRIVGDKIVGDKKVGRSIAAGSFDYSYFGVLALGIAGLFWVRRQSQTL